MKTKMNIKTILFVAMLTLACTTTYAQRRHYHISHHSYYRPIVTTVVARPVVTKHVCNRLTKNDRLEMALAFLKENHSLSISQYSKITGLTHAMAEAELDAFAISKKNPIKLVMDGKKKKYVV